MGGGAEAHFVELQPRICFGASLRSTGIEVYSLGINTYSSDQTVASTSTLQ